MQPFSRRMLGSWLGAVAVGSEDGYAANGGWGYGSMGVSFDLSLVVSVLSLVVAATTAWLTLFRRGTVKMIRPSLIAFLDARGRDGPKVWFRALLYTTAYKGDMIESMFVKLKRGETQQNFSFWVCGERDVLASGCGLFVSTNGAALNHHFVLPKDGSRFEFLAGDYTLEVFASRAGVRSPLLLARIALHLNEEHAKSLKNPDENVYFDWWPDSARYNAHIVRRPEVPEMPEFFSRMFPGTPQS